VRNGLSKAFLASARNTLLSGGDWVLILKTTLLRAMIGIPFALLSAAVSGVAIVLVGRNSKATDALNVSMLISFTGLLVILPFAALLTDFSTVSLSGVLLFGAGGILMPGLVRLFYYVGLKRLGPSVNSSVFSVYPIYSALFAVFFLSELLTAANWVGVAAIASGVIFIEMSCRDNTCADRTLKYWFFPIVGGLTYGVSAIFMKSALNISNAPFLGVAIAYCFAFVPYFVIFGYRKKAGNHISLRKDLRLFWIAGVGQGISWILSFYALSVDAVSVVVPLLSLEPLFVALFAFLALKQQERLSIKLAVSIVVTVLGVVLVVT
jgi:drug/metabolite transporter, DME family